MQGLFGGGNGSIPRPVAPSPFSTSAQATPSSVTNNLRNESRGVKHAKKLLSRHPDMSFGVQPDDVEEIGHPQPPSAIPTPIPTPPPTITRPPPNQLLNTIPPPRPNLHPNHQPNDPSHPPQLALDQLKRYAIGGFLTAMGTIAGTNLFGYLT